MLTRRNAGKLLVATAASGILAETASAPVLAAEKPVKIGITLPLTGTDALDAKLVNQGFQMAIEEANDKQDVPGYRIAVLVLNTASATTGQYDPAQAATNARTVVADPEVVVNLGPFNSGSGKAMAPILSEADLATITPTSTNPDITDPKFATEFRPAGKAIYFRTCATDAFQAPFMANYMKQVLKLKSVFILDDSGAGGVGGADQFQRRAGEIQLYVLGREHLDPLAADYSATLTKIKGLQADALYYAGVAGAGTKLIKQSYFVLPQIVKAGVDGIYGSDILTGAGFPAVQGWYITVPAPHIIDTPSGTAWQKRFVARFGNQPSDYSALAYDAGLIAVAAMRRVVVSGQPLNRQNVEAAIVGGTVPTLQGDVSFNSDGDLKNPIISIFRVEHDPNYPTDDVAHQFKYIGVAPST
jgi:branched-chain amino acid transport system substrate-binding protein